MNITKELTDTIEIEKRFEEINSKLFNDLIANGYEEQLNFILENNSADISPDFLGFVHIYYHLSLIVPLDRTIYDLGCCYGFQAWFFRNHYCYIGIDYLTDPKYQLHIPNSTYYTMTIAEYIRNFPIDKEEPHFAICNYVPPWRDNNEKLVRDNFQHMFVYYPKDRNYAKTKLRDRYICEQS